MTEQELEILRLKTRLAIHELLFRAMFRMFSRSYPQFADWKANLFRGALEKAENQTIPGIPPEYSDLAAGEWRDTLRDIVKYIEE